MKTRLLSQILSVLCIVAVACGSYAAASSEVSASNGVRAMSEPYKLLLVAGISVIAGVIVYSVLPAIRLIPPGLRRMTWAALIGWAAACTASALLASFLHAFYLAFAFGQHGGLLTPEDWIYARAVIGGLALTTVPWMLILRSGRDDRPLPGVLPGTPGISTVASSVLAAFLTQLCLLRRPTAVS